MKNLSKPLLIAACLLAILLAAVVEMLRFAGTFRSTRARSPGACQAIPLAGSSQDLQVDAQRGLAYLSLLDRDIPEDTAAIAGTVMLLDLNIAEPSARAALTFDSPGLRPIALSLAREPDRPARLLVVSRPAAGPYAIETFEQSPDGGFVPRSTLRDPAFTEPGAIAAADGRRFYVTNVGPHNVLLRSGRGTLVYHDGEQARVLVDDLAYPTGVALAPDGATLYVAEGLAKAIRLYRRAADGTLVADGRLDLDVAPGRLSVDAQGSLWIAAHPRLLRLRAHLREPGRPAPTLVLRYDPRSRRLEEIYANDGSAIAAGSVAARWRDRLVIGATRQEKVLICRTTP